MNRNWIVLDTEVTHVETELAHICEIALRHVDGRDPWVRRLFVPVDMPEGAYKVHGISNADLEGCPTFAQVADELRQILESVEAVVGYNVNFDMAIINNEFQRLGIEIKQPKIVCLLKIWQKNEPRSLTDAYKKFVNKNGFEGAHGALADVHATCEVMLGMFGTWGITDETPIEEIMPPPKDGQWGPSHHIRWKDESQTCLVFNFGKSKDIPVMDTDAGYLNWVIGKDFPVHVKQACRRALEIRKDANPKIADQVLATWARGMI